MQTQASQLPLTTKLISGATKKSVNFHPFHAVELASGRRRQSVLPVAQAQLALAGPFGRPGTVPLKGAAAW